VLTVYAIPYRDCGSYSAGGLPASQYRTFIDQVAAGIGSRKAVVVLEPDALGQIYCLSQSLEQERYDLLNYAVTKFKSNPNTYVYMDISMWLTVDTAVSRLGAAGIAQADGFALNVSHYYYTSDVIAKGKQISAGVGNKHFIIDTGRNGNGLYTRGTHSGACPDWANPPGRALGPRAGSPTADPLVDAYVWVKTPGESDANCGGYPRAGAWMPEYALGLAQRASWGL
jgi:endoglucanase